MIFKMELNKLINWCGLSEILTGNSNTVRANRKNKKFSKEINSLEEHLIAWAKENNIKTK
jgi:hypothetical protein